LHCRADTLGQRHLDENDRLLRQRGMKKSETTAVGFETPAQIRPAGDFMDGFVVNQLFEDDRRCTPVDPLELEKAGIEPGAE
jgi:hypothetical protein